MSADAYRLTPADEDRIRTAIADAVDRWSYGRGAGNRYVPSAQDLTTLERIAHRSIGCDHSDLRDVELAWIAERVAMTAQASACRPTPSTGPTPTTDAPSAG